MTRIQHILHKSSTVLEVHLGQLPGRKTYNSNSFATFNNNKACRTLLYLSHAIVILVHGIKLETFSLCSTNHISATAIDLLFTFITYPKMTMAYVKCTM